MNLQHILPLTTQQCSTPHQTTLQCTLSSHCIALSHFTFGLSPHLDTAHNVIHTTQFPLTTLRTYHIAHLCTPFRRHIGNLTLLILTLNTFIMLHTFLHQYISYCEAPVRPVSNLWGQSQRVQLQGRQHIGRLASQEDEAHFSARWSQTFLGAIWKRVWGHFVGGCLLQTFLGGIW